MLHYFLCLIILCNCLHGSKPNDPPPPPYHRDPNYKLPLPQTFAQMTNAAIQGLTQTQTALVQKNTEQDLKLEKIEQELTSFKQLRVTDLTSINKNTSIWNERFIKAEQRLLKLESQAPQPQIAHFSSSQLPIPINPSGSSQEIQALYLQRNKDIACYNQRIAQLEAREAQLQRKMSKLEDFTIINARIIVGLSIIAGVTSMIAIKAFWGKKNS